MCTGSLPGLSCSRPLLLPGGLVRTLIATAAGGARLGVVVPAAQQAASAEADWSAVASAVRVVAASPYGPAAGLARAAAVLAGWRPDLVILDCLGFGGPMKQIVARAVGVPVVLPRTVLAAAAAAFL